MKQTFGVRTNGPPYLQDRRNTTVRRAVGVPQVAEMGGAFENWKNRYRSDLHAGG
jgi:hypothetical protein